MPRVFFSHLSFHEFYVAKYVVSQLKSSIKEEERKGYDFIVSHRENPSYQVVFTFLVGLLEPDPYTLEKALDKLFSYDKNYSAEEVSLSIHCLAESPSLGVEWINKLKIKQFLEDLPSSTLPDYLKIIKEPLTYSEKIRVSLGYWSFVKEVLISEVYTTGYQNFFSVPTSISSEDVSYLLSALWAQFSEYTIRREPLAGWDGAGAPPMYSWYFSVSYSCFDGFRVLEDLLQEGLSPEQSIPVLTAAMDHHDRNVCLTSLELFKEYVACNVKTLSNFEDPHDNSHRRAFEKVIIWGDSTQSVPMFILQLLTVALRHPIFDAEKRMLKHPDYHESGFNSFERYSGRYTDNDNEIIELVAYIFSLLPLQGKQKEAIEGWLVDVKGLYASRATKFHAVLRDQNFFIDSFEPKTSPNSIFSKRRAFPSRNENEPINWRNE